MIHSTKLNMAKGWMSEKCLSKHLERHLFHNDTSKEKALKRKKDKLQNIHFLLEEMDRYNTENFSSSKRKTSLIILGHYVSN